MPGHVDPPQNGLDHVVVVGGTPAEWLKMSANEWTSRLTALAKGAAVEGAHWVTLLPHHGPEFSVEELAAYNAMMTSLPFVSTVNALHGDRFVWQRPNDPKVIIDTIADGHVRFAATIEALRQKGAQPEDVDESVLSDAILFPAVQEPDLVVVMGPANLIPDSMVWELAYSELVFIDLGWWDFDASHLELAIDDFNRRHRRFGGLDS
jgi:undecaprenyl diphosphate synthase